MANRTFQQFTQSLVPGFVILTGKVAIGATGAPTLTTGQFNGIASVVRTGAGLYTITLQDKYVDFCSVTASVISNAALPVVDVVVSAVDVVTAGTVNIKTVDWTTGATLTDPSPEDILVFTLTLANSTARL